MLNPNTNLYVVTLERLSYRTNLAAIYPTASKGDLDSTESLRHFTEEIGIPANLKCNMAAAFVGRHTDFQRLVQRLGINLTYAEPYRHNQLQQVDVAI